ncbi:Histone deacetylation protein Rxt3 [Forsythia ovata]|uniref:Histone deacetylation protein Rxt3 n=1 Tax=Forsythia ovata TaxID=205694 RepID=A0ABD1WUS8_9LAMI
MNTTPNRRSHEDGGNGSGNVGGSGSHSHSSALKYPHDDHGTFSSVGKVTASARHEYHAPYDMGQDARMPKIMPRNESSRDVDRRSPLLPNMLFRVSSSSNESHSDHVVGSESRLEWRDPKDSDKDIKVENRDIITEPRELHQSGKGDKNVKHESRVDDSKDAKHERDTFPEHKGDIKLDKEGFNGSSSHLNWKDSKEHHGKQYPDAPGGNVDPWHSSRSNVHGPTDSAKEASNVEDRDFAEAREAVGENKVDLKGDDKFKDKDRKRKEVKHRDWGEREKERGDRRNNLQLDNSSGENKELVREDRESERWGSEKKDPVKDKEKLNDRAKDYVKREAWNGAEKEASHSEKEPMDISGRSAEQENLTLEQKKQKDHDSWKNTDRSTRDRKKERDADIEAERPDKRSRYHEKESEEGGIDDEGSTEREIEAFNSGIQQRRRMLRPRGSPQMGNREPRFRSRTQDIEGSQGKLSFHVQQELLFGKADVSCVVYKIGGCMQELLKLWKEFQSSQADKTCESPQNGPTLEIRISAEHVTATNRQVRGGQLWGTDIYTVDSDLVAVLMHTGYCRPTASPPPSAAQELRATVRVLPPQDCYVSTLRNNVRSRAWGAAIGCSYRVERCCIVKKGGGIIDLEPCLTHSSTLEPTLAPVAVERTMTTRAAASNALRQQRFVREVTIQFNLCMEPWLKYSISAVADKGLKKPLFTSSRLKKGEVLYLETHSRRLQQRLRHLEQRVGDLIPTRILANGERSVVDGECTVVDVFRWARCKRPLPQKLMLSIGIPLPLDHVEVLEENLEWDDIAWSQTGVWIAGKEYNLARAHFLSPN